MIKITSSSNSKYKFFKSLQSKKARYEHGKYCVEGIKSVHDAICSGRRISEILVSDEFSDGFDFGGNTVYEIPKALFDRLSDTSTPQGVMAVMEMEKRAFVPKMKKSYIFCDRLNDPGNAGTIIRTADAAGLGGVIMSAGSVDIYSPKTVRASMGSFFNIETFTDMTYGELKKLRDSGFLLIGGILSDGAMDYRDADYTRPAIIVVGNEANGISDEVKELCVPVKIPIYGNAESLNASVAAALLMYEWARNNFS